MNKSLIFTSENQNETGDFTIEFPRPIDLHIETKKWNVTLVQLSLHYSFWNISRDATNDIFKYNNGVDDVELDLEDGCYSLLSLIDHIHDKMVDAGDYTVVNGVNVFNINFEIDPSDGVVTLLLSGGYTVDFTGLGIRNVFGFNSGVLSADTVAPNRARINGDIENILLHCSLCSGQCYYNGRMTDIIYSFFIDSQPNQPIRLEPSNVIVGCALSQEITNVQLYFTDQKGNKLHLRGLPVLVQIILSPA